MNEEAEKLKAEANEFFKAQNYKEAIALYARAIEKAPTASVPNLIAKQKLKHFFHKFVTSMYSLFCIEHVFLEHCPPHLYYTATEVLPTYAKKILDLL